MAFAEDIADFFATDTGFGEFAVYDGTSTVAGIYGADPADAFGVGANVPQFTVASGDIAADPRGKTLVLTAGTFTIREFTPDETGRITALKLEKA